jgi:hypothetical protein
MRNAMKNNSIFLKALGAAAVLFVMFWTAGSAAAEIMVANTASAETKAATAYNSKTGEVLVVYLEQQGTGGNLEVRAKRFKDGVQQGGVMSPFAACPYTATGRPAVAYSPGYDQFLIAVPDKMSGNSSNRVLVSPMAGDGSSIGNCTSLFDEPNSLYFEGPYKDGSGSLRVTHNSILNEFVVTAQLEKTVNGATQSGVWGQRVGPSGKIGSSIHIYNPVKAHSIAYAPVANTTPYGGRYLFLGDGIARLLDATLEPIPVTARTSARNRTPATPSDPDIALQYSLGGSGAQGQFDVAYGEVQGMKRFFIVYSNAHLCKPALTKCPNLWEQATGIWGTFVDPEKLFYPDWAVGSDGTIRNNEKADNTPFPVSYTWRHWMLDNLNPRVTYNADAKAFFVAWHELPADDANNDQKLSHIRGTYVDSFVPDGQYNTSNFPDPAGRSFVISDTLTGSCKLDPIWQYSRCSSNEDPDMPDLAPAGGSKVMVVWQQHNPTNAANLDIVGNLFDGSPQVQVKVNDIQDLVLVAQGAAANVSVWIAPGNRMDKNVDAWAVLFQYDFSTGALQPWPPMLLGQGPLSILQDTKAPKLDIGNLNWLPKGLYLLFVGFDTKMNGTIDLGSAYYDTILIYVN